MAEIKIALGYLNKIDPIEIGRDNKDIILKDKPDKDKNKQLRYGLLKAKVVKDEYEDDYFGYEFIIPKPKEILIIDKEADKDLSDKLKKYNIHLTKDFNTKNLDYELVVVKDSDLIQKLQADDKLLSDFPSRVLLVTTDKIEGANKNRLFKISPDEYNTLTGIQNTEKADEFKFKLFSQWMLQYVSKSDERKSDEEEKSNKIYLHGETTGKSSVEGGYKIISKLIDQFYSIKNKYLLDNKEPFENKLKSNVKEFNSDKSVNHILNKYKQISKKMVEEFAKLTFTKYDEDIVTLPRAYRASKIASDKSDHGEKNDVFKRPILEDNIIYKNDTEIKELTEEQKNKLIYLKRHATLNDSYYYAEALSGAQSYFNLLINGNKNSADYLNQKVIVQLLENVFSGILIIDERVNEYYEHVEDDVKKQLRCANIFTYDDKKIGAILDIKKIIDVKSGVGKINDKEIKFLIIHQGIIDKLNEKDNVKIIDGLKQLQNIVPNVVITSGRGLPKDNLPEGFKFIPYSTIAETIMKPYHEKFLLTNILLKLTSYGK